MKKNIKDFLHFHLGCEASIKGEDSTLDQKITPFALDKCLCGDWIVKPYLREFSDMTDQEYSIYRRIKNTEIKIDRGNYYEIFEHNWEAVKLLLLWEFDVFGLIEDGLAIRKSKVERPANQR